MPKKVICTVLSLALIAICALCLFRMNDKLICFRQAGGVCAIVGTDKETPGVIWQDAINFTSSAKVASITILSKVEVSPGNCKVRRGTNKVNLFPFGSQHGKDYADPEFPSARVVGLEVLELNIEHRRGVDSAGHPAAMSD